MAEWRPQIQTNGVAQAPWRTPALAILFALSITQWPLFSSNQNTYFLHGMAEAEFGFLLHDWLAGCTDHIPVFSALVALLQKCNLLWLSYGIHAVLGGVYFLSLFLIAQKVYPALSRALPASLFSFGFTVLHSAWLWNGTWASESLRKNFFFDGGRQLATLLTTGVADQSLGRRRTDTCGSANTRQ
jgi:hypothetical protein